MRARSGWWLAFVLGIGGLPAAANAGRTWYVNGLTGNDWLPTSGSSIENIDGSANNQLRTLGHAFLLAGPGDTVVVDGPTQVPVVGSPGFDTKPQMFRKISASQLTLQCRDPASVLNGGVETDADNLVVFNCIFQGSGNNPGFYAGSSNGHYFENVNFTGTGNSSGVGFEGAGNGYQFQHSRIQSLSYGILLDAPGGAGTSIQFNTFNGNTYSVYWAGAFGTFKYNLVNASNWGAVSGSTSYTPGKYDVDSNWYSGGNGSYFGGPDEYFSNYGPSFSGYFMLNPDSPAINTVYDPFLGNRRTPGCCDVVTRQGNGGNSEFTNWRMWVGSTWVPIPQYGTADYSTSSPAYVYQHQIYLNDGFNCLYVRGNPTMGLAGAKLKRLQLDRGAYYNSQPGYRSDIDSDPSTPGREIEVRAVSCGSDQGLSSGFNVNDAPSGFAAACGAGAPVQAPPGLFSKVINGSTLASAQPGQQNADGSPLKDAIGSVDSGAPCWQAQLFLSRVLP